MNVLAGFIVAWLVIATIWAVTWAIVKVGEWLYWKWASR